MAVATSRGRGNTTPEATYGKQTNHRSSQPTQRLGPRYVGHDPQRLALLSVLMAGQAGAQTPTSTAIATTTRTPQATGTVAATATSTSGTPQATATATPAPVNRAAAAAIGSGILTSPDRQQPAPIIQAPAQQAPQVPVAPQRISAPNTGEAGLASDDSTRHTPLAILALVVGIGMVVTGLSMNLPQHKRN